MANEPEPKAKLKLAGPEPFGLNKSWLLTGLILVCMAVVSNQWLGRWAVQLPANYVNETNMREESRFRNTANAEWQSRVSNVRHIDQTIISSPTYNIIEGSLQVYFDSGELNFEASGLYGVDCVTRANLSGFGNNERGGQFLFPPHVKPGFYTIWDPLFIGPRQAAFVRSDILDGLVVYVFQLTATGLDETKGYSSLAEVPERYEAHTNVLGTAWVEPISGQTIDYEDSSVSYFVDPTSGTRIADFNQWTERFTPETITAQQKTAREARLKILVLETWLPAVCLAGGLACLVQVGVRFARPQKSPPPPGNPP